MAKVGADLRANVSRISSGMSKEGADLRTDALRRDGMEESRCDGVGEPSSGTSGVSSNELPMDMGRSVAPWGSDGVESLAYWNGAGGAGVSATGTALRRGKLRRLCSVAGAAATDSVSGTLRSSLKGLKDERRCTHAHARWVGRCARLTGPTVRSSPEKEAEEDSARSATAPAAQRTEG